MDKVVEPPAVNEVGEAEVEGLSLAAAYGNDEVKSTAVITNSRTDEIWIFTFFDIAFILLFRR